jgi:hypothetical protein
MSSIGGFLVCAAPWTGYEKKVHMLIRITHLNKWPSPPQETVGTDLIAHSMQYLEASYTAENKKPASNADQSDYC